MNKIDLITSLKIIITNYHKILKNISFLLFYLILIVTSGLIITLPIWYIATNYSNGYTYSVLLTLMLIVIFVLTGKLKNWITSQHKSGKTSTQIILIPVKKAIIFILFTLGFYGIFLSLSLDLILLSILIAAFYFIILGYFIFISRKLNGSE